MKLLFLFFSIIIAVSSIVFEDLIINHMKIVGNLFTNNTTTIQSLKQLSKFPSTSYFSTSKAAVNMTTPRGIQKAFLAREQAEGAGARVRRSIGTPQLKNFSPFLMLDHFTIKPGAGFPDHPHRGQET